MAKKQTKDPTLKKNNQTFTKNDQELLKAIKKHGSINKASKKLKRSYSSSQKRIKNLEKEFGKLVKSTKGGKKKGGTKLTKNAKELLKKYQKLQTEYKKITQINITSIKGKIKNQKNLICTVKTPIGKIKSISTHKFQKNQKAIVLIREDAITIQKNKINKPEKTSARNKFTGTIKQINKNKNIIQLKIESNNQTINTTITKESKEKMNLKKGEKIQFSFKATATETIKPT